jgi:hypothetical protein
MAQDAPRVFLSYAHDGQEHKDWVEKLATRLQNDGVAVTLDQWDLPLGGDLPGFMSRGLTGADRVLAICTSSYVAKADAGQGGAGYETMILTAQMLGDLTTDRIIPVIRGNDGANLVPVFLSSRLYVDFRSDAAFEEKYAELLEDIHKARAAHHPPLGKNPYDEKTQHTSSNIYEQATVAKRPSDRECADRILGALYDHGIGKTVNMFGDVLKLAGLETEDEEEQERLMNIVASPAGLFGEGLVMCHSLRGNNQGQAIIEVHGTELTARGRRYVENLRAKSE